ncbi:hypothetical protein [Bacillus sp. FSL K6-3431]|uniref:hypothetical protein n=1 Tax=Bacillus sp. FSL K6-3431 TaxID=2921500 RepID=UPI0030FB5BAE
MAGYKIELIADDLLGGVLREYEIYNDGWRIMTPYIHVKGDRYRMTNRKANVGERIIVTSKWYSFMPGSVLEVISGLVDAPNESNQVNFAHPSNGPSRMKRIENEYYHVLEPIATEASPQSNDDIITNLVRRMAELERKDVEHREFIESLDVEMSDVWRKYGELDESISGIKRDIETWAQEVEELKHATKPKKVLINVEELARLLGGVAND